MRKTILLSIFLIFIIVTPAEAVFSVANTPLGAGHPPATARLSVAGNHIDYTAKLIKGTTVQFTDLSKGNENYIRWDFGDGTHVEGVKKPVHIYKKKGYYITMLTIRCKESKSKMWVHKTIIIK